MPNSFAYLMLLVWPAISLWLFHALSRERALIWSILGSYLILPPSTAFDFPLVPPLDKAAIPSLTAYLICAVKLGMRLNVLPASRIGALLVLMFLLVPVVSVMKNSDPIIFWGGGIKGLGAHDAISTVISQFIVLAPFFLARRYLATETAQREILVALSLGGLAYSLPMLVEIRLSPQINVWVYGFFQHDFIQMMRQGGFRPIVFLPHGIWVAFFTLMTLVAAIGLWRQAPPEARTRSMLIVGYLGVLIVLCKSAAALVYSIVLFPLVRFASLKLQLRVAAVLAAIAVFYPLLRSADLVPVDTILAETEVASGERAASLRYRFDNEVLLLTHARDRPLFGWGPWGRNHLYDPENGTMLTTVDGRWIVVIGTYGVAGYFAEFGLLALPLVLLAWRARRWDRVSPYSGPLALILAFNMVDLLLNATLIPFTWLLTGALLGYAESASARTETEAVPTHGPGADGLAAAPPPRTIL